MLEFEHQNIFYLGPSRFVEACCLISNPLIIWLLKHSRIFNIFRSNLLFATRSGIVEPKDSFAD